MSETVPRPERVECSECGREMAGVRTDLSAVAWLFRYECGVSRDGDRRSSGRRVRSRQFSPRRVPRGRDGPGERMTWRCCVARDGSILTRCNSGRARAIPTKGSFAGVVSASRLFLNPPRTTPILRPLRGRLSPVSEPLALTPSPNNPHVGTPERGGERHG